MAAMNGSAAETAAGRDRVLIAGRARLVGASLAQSSALLLADRRHRRRLESKRLVTVTYEAAGEFERGACRSARADVRLGVFRYDRDSAYSLAGMLPSGSTSVSSSMPFLAVSARSNGHQELTNSR